jgi:signal transduction histidine kinase
MIKNTKSDLLKNPEMSSLPDFIIENESVFIWKSNGRNIESREYSENIVRLTGYTSKELAAFPDGLYSLMYPAELDKVKKSLNVFLNNPSSEKFSALYLITNKAEGTVWVKEEIKAFNNSRGELEEYRGVIYDVSELKKMELSLLDENERLKQLNQSKDKFISILSHDLRSPFTSILGFTEILMNEPDLTSNEKNEYLNYIHDSSLNQLQLINYLLDWSRLQTGRMKIEPGRLHAQTIVFNCIASLTGNAIRKNIEIKARILDKLFIQADEKLVTQVITNLLSNAIKFSQENTYVEISAEIFNDDKVEFVIKDQGVGIPDNYKEKLFKVEKKFSTEGTKGEKGTGLGLSLCKEIVEKHKGDIWYYSQVNQGSEFHFTVPSSPNTILLVENNPEDRSFVEKLVSQNFSEYKLIVTDNGYEAITIIANEIPSLIIAKHDLPFMDGIQLLKTIRKGEKGYKVPVVALISDLPDEKIKSYYEYGITALLQKPFDIKNFKEKVFSVLN